MSESNTKTFSREDIRKLKGRTDWDRLQAEGDYEGPQEFEVDWTSARIVTPEPKQMVSIRLDPDVLAFFRSHGKGYQTRINAVLRAYMEARRAD